LSKGRARSLLVLAALLFTGPIGCWEQWSNHWFPQMKWQPAVQAFERTMHQGRVDPFLPPEGSVPIDGGVAPIDPNDEPASDLLVNPRPMSLASLDNGRQKYAIFCSPCHGAGGAGDDIRVTYTRANAPLADLEGEEVAGDWTLRVRDLEGRDVGRLNRWFVEAEFAPSDETLVGEAHPDVEIPDATSAGVASTIAIDGEGTVKDVRVRVEIAHTYVGDLHIELVAPSGQGAVLHNQTGHSSDDLRLTYDRALAPALDVLVGEPVGGDWTLRVRDLERADVGRLERWRIELRYSV